MGLYDALDKYSFGLLPGGVKPTWKGGPAGLALDRDFQIQQAREQSKKADDATFGYFPGGDSPLPPLDIIRTTTNPPTGQQSGGPSGGGGSSWILPVAAIAVGVFLARK